MEHLDKAAHVGAFVMMRQIHGHIDHGDGVLGGLVTIPNAERETDIFDADAVDGDAAVVTLILRVFERGHGKNKIPLLRGQQWER